MARPVSLKIFTETLAKWPKQALRPDHQLQDVFLTQVQKRYETYTPKMEAEQMFKARSLQMLQQNRFQDRYKLSGPMLEPKSQPTYFHDLVHEIEEAPNRSWFQRVGKRLSGMIRLK